MTSSSPEVDKILQIMLDEPAPPLPTAHQALTVARKVGRRRTALAAAGSALAATAILVAVAANLTLVGAGPTASPDVAGLAPAAPPQQQLPLPKAPDKDVASAQGTRNGEILMAAVPAGLTGVLQKPNTDSYTPSSTWQTKETTRYVSTVEVVLTTGHADGLLSVAINGGVTGLGDDLCAKTVTDHLQPGLPGCDVVTVNGIPIRVMSLHDDRGDVNVAIRLLDGGFVVVQAQQGIPPFRRDGQVPADGQVPPGGGQVRDGQHTTLGGWPALPAVPLTKAQLAALAANPALLP